MGNCLKKRVPEINSVAPKYTGAFPAPILDTSSLEDGDSQLNIPEPQTPTLKSQRGIQYPASPLATHSDNTLSPDSCRSRSVDAVMPQNISEDDCTRWRSGLARLKEGALDHTIQEEDENGTEV